MQSTFQEASFSSVQNTFDIAPLSTPLFPIPKYPKSQLDNSYTLARVKNRTDLIFLIYNNQKDKKIIKKQLKMCHSISSGREKKHNICRL